MMFHPLILESPDIQNIQPEVTYTHLRAILLKYGRVNPTVNAHLLSVITTGRILGSEWCSKWANEFSSQNQVGMYFFPSSDADDQHVVWRQIRFSELLFNIQWLPGFTTRRKEWQGHPPEAIVAELESAFYMWSCGHWPAFQHVGVQGQRTPDFEITLSFGLKCGWEAKARLENLPFNEKQLQNVLREARRQLPRDIANIILVRIPESWTLDAAFEHRVQNLVDHLFRNSNRAISVLFHWELWETPCDGVNNFGLSGMEFTNLKWDILTGRRRVMEDYSGFPPGWIHFEDV